LAWDTCSPRTRQQLDRIEHAAEIGQRGQDEGRHDRDVVELLGVHRVDEAGQPNITAPSSTVASVTSGCGCACGEQHGDASTMAPTITPRSTAPAT
jgi:hypothetical protein